MLKKVHNLPTAREEPREVPVQSAQTSALDQAQNAHKLHKHVHRWVRQSFFPRHNDLQGLLRLGWQICVQSCTLHTKVCVLCGKSAPTGGHKTCTQQLVPTSWVPEIVSPIYNYLSSVILDENFEQTDFLFLSMSSHRMWNNFSAKARIVINLLALHRNNINHCSKKTFPSHWPGLLWFISPLERLPLHFVDWRFFHQKNQSPFLKSKSSHNKCDFLETKTQSLWLPINHSQGFLCISGFGKISAHFKLIRKGQEPTNNFSSSILLHHQRKWTLLNMLAKCVDSVPMTCLTPLPVVLKANCSSVHEFTDYNS